MKEKLTINYIELGECKYVKAASDYYDEEGNLIIAIGDVITLEASNRLEEAVNLGILFTTKTEIKQLQKNINKKDVIYTKHGLIFKSKDDYDQFVIQGFKGYSIVNGIMMSDEERMAKQNKLYK